MTKYYFVLFDGYIYILDKAPELDSYPFFKDADRDDLDGVTILENNSVLTLAGDTELTYFLQLLNKYWAYTVTKICVPNNLDKVKNKAINNTNKKLLL